MIQLMDPLHQNYANCDENDYICKWCYHCCIS